MDSECRAIIEAISVLSSGNDKEASSTISSVEEYLNGLLRDKQHFKRAYIAICAKIFELTCQLPHQSLSRLVHVSSSEVINTLCTCLTTSSLQGSQAIQKLVKEFCSLRLTDTLWSGQVDEQTLNNLINMPQLLGNRLQLDLDEFFVPKTFYTSLIAVVCEVLARCHTAISAGSHDCSLVHISYLVSKIATSGYHGILYHMITYLDSATSKDMIWQRISSTLITQLSVYAVDKFVECVLLNTRPSLIGSSATCRILGNSLQTQRRLSHALCHKCLLVQNYDKPWILYNIAGYLLSSIPGKQLMLKTLLDLLKVWSDISLIRHLDYPHLVHISRAIVLFTCCLSDNNFLTSEICSDMFHQLMQGMEHHMSNPIVDQRLVAMRLAECVSQKVIKDGSPLEFDINENDETTLLANMAIPISEQEKKLHRNVDHVIQPADDVTPPADHVIQSKVPVKVHVSDDDDDDDLIPFDIAPQHPRNLPRYLREAISGIVEGSSSDQLDLVKAIPNLIKSQPHDLSEVCDELCKVLLHWATAGSNEESKQMTKEALVTLLCNCPVQAATYLTGQFHCHGYSIEQRLFILEILSVSSQQLSNLRDLKGASQFIPVAGHFFFPLMKYFSQNDKDDLIVAHVIHTLAHVIHCAAVATVRLHAEEISNKMSEHLLELLLDYRSHPNAFIRQSTLCSIAIILSTSSTINHPVLIKEWLQDVINNDNDHHCRSLATDAIKLL